MTQLEINRIKKVFHDNYFDLGIYRWLNRMKNWLKPFFALTFVAVLSMALIWSSWPITYWAFAFIGTITVGGIDHFIIGLSLKRILNKLESENIKISLESLLDICSDITPN
jgi:hypothetical protein